ncbi:DUF1850 domain-containing protein [Natronorubrum sp. FCH18a]|uniref:DUF1850 domain-containing protein n=1 Tax=Natronorubrum sp. FCH18a TaxID=3447018 RepID=UPI003F50F80A
MSRLTRRLVVVAVVLLVLGATATVTTTGSADKTLVVTDADTDERLLEVPVDDKDQVTLSYTHSVEKTTVEDIYVVDGTRLRMERMVFHSHGAGLPSDAPIERTEEGFVLELDETYEELGVVPGSIAGHELVVGDERYDLVALSDGPVVITLVDRIVVDDIFDADPRFTPLLESR